MDCAYLKRVWVVLVIMAIITFSSRDNLQAQTAIVYRSGVVKITKPDGTALTIKKGDSLPKVPSGSIVEILEGGIDITPLEGFIQVVVSGSIATVEEGERIIASLDPETKVASFKVVSGQVSVITGNTSTTIKEQQVARLSLDVRTGVVEVESVSGTVETITIGIIVSVPETAIARVNVNPKTRKVHVESIRGEIKVVSVDGELIMLAKAKAVDLTGTATGRIQTFGKPEKDMLFVPREEPPEPERPEGSPHRP